MRITRAALRAQAHDEFQSIHEDPDAGTSRNQDESSEVHETDRPALKDITAENYPTAEDAPGVEESAPLKRSKSKKKGKQNKKDKNEEEATVADNLEAQHIELVSAEVVDESQEQSPETQEEEEESPDTASLEPQSAQQPSSEKVVDVAVQPLAHSSTPSPIRNEAPKTPRFNPDIHVPEHAPTTPAVSNVEDSFVEQIKSRSPSKMHYTADVARSPSYDPSNQLPRIEDSVDAIDALEDAIEEFSERLPALDDLKIESPVKSSKNTPAKLNLHPNSKAPGSSQKSEPVAAKSPRKSPSKSPSKPAPADRRPSVQPRSTATSRASSAKAAIKPLKVAKQAKKPIIDGLKPRESSSASAMPLLTFSNSPSKSLPNTTKKRVPSTTLSTNKPAFVPAKSAKPPTRPTFSLPGEAISAKLKAQREERLKREEEAEKERKIFKARPAPAKTSRPSVLPRDTKASQARLSIYSTGTNKENVAPKREPAKMRPSSFHSGLSRDVTKANSSVRRTNSVVGAKSSPAKPRVSSVQLAAGQKLSVTKQDQAQQKARGKEVFARSKIEMERLEKDRKEKEEATRKARAEAAERGRQASREWAEKQKRKLAMQAAEKMARGDGVASAGAGASAVATS
ncbi:hypothetical protein PV08_07476 [Exophiala spinifera]|uniref:Carboxylesterase family protein n=1 Tax=Exophiala spinifera TaxID=91928 RepID=A0A0D1ZPF0_9EURO|nr:uncharacterized protein PV08_07476 [Exophiala spinifera]KIW14692.1 hypothetical protein PV08_07476 [Exophiala spinifera]